MGEVVDINCDMGESFGRWSLGNDAGLMPYISSANIACGWHGGDPGVMRETCAIAKEHGVAIGVHCGFPDLLGFGRRQMLVAPSEVRDYVLYQYGALQAFASAAGAEIEHVKPHGAFYVMINNDRAYTEALIEAMKEADPSLVVILMSPDAVAQVAEAGVGVVPEAFPDLDYQTNGQLIIERAKKARDPKVVAERLVRVVREGKLRALDGTDIDVHARSFCLHGDGPNAVDVASACKDRIAAEGMELAPLRAVLAARVS